MPNNIKIYPAVNNQTTISALSDITIDCVANGASIGFMHPLCPQKAQQFWADMLQSADNNEKVVLVAEDIHSKTIVGTAQLVLDLPENQPHRADVSKVQVSSNSRNQGIASALMRAVEEIALKHKRFLLVLDTTTGSAAEKLYSKLGWQRVGDIPNFALLPTGELSGTTVFYRQLTNPHR